ELLRAGYLEEWTYHRTYSGTPQGSVLSPFLSNLYLDKFDRYIETELIPAYTRGVERRANPTYNRIKEKRYRMRKQGRMVEAKALPQQLRAHPSLDPYDPTFRRLRFIRYAD